MDRIDQPDGSTDWRSAPGGLVTALEPVMRNRHGAWVGWHGAPDETLEPFDNDGLHLVPVPLSSRELADYYEGFSNATLWPIYHDVIVPPEFHREWWDAYVTVNQRFADRVAEISAEGAVVWVQDYQLQLVPRMLRELRPDLRIGFFLHIPFPPSELYVQLPWRNEILEGLLGADLVGFQLLGGAQNFLRLVRQRLQLETRRDLISTPDGRDVLARAYPIAIDAKKLNALAGTEEAAARAKQIRRDLGDPRLIFLGVDRMDYTKGLPERIQAFGELVTEGRVDADDAVFVQLAIPSRERVEKYRVLRDDIDRLVGRINGDAGRLGRPPIIYLHTSFSREEMAALYRAADIMVVTPLRDGMNLVAKEYAACRQADDGALVLSEFAGAARELRQAYLVNPHDVNGLKERLVQAMEDTTQNKARRMRFMRRQVVEHDIDWWANHFLTDLEGVRPRLNRAHGAAPSRLSLPIGRRDQHQAGDPPLTLLAPNQLRTSAAASTTREISGGGFPGHDWSASWRRMAICTRLATASFVNSRDTCALTVASLIYNEVATSAFDAPDPTAAATSRSRSVRVLSRCAAARRRSEASASPKWDSSVRVTEGETTASPAATRRTALMISAGGVSLTRNPLAPARSALITCSSAWNVVSTITWGGAASRRKAVVAVMPSISAIRMSIRTTSG